MKLASEYLTTKGTKYTKLKAGILDTFVSFGSARTILADLIF